MENIRENLAKNLIKLRKTYHVTQQDLGNKLNYSDKAVSKWERGESMPDIEVLYQISRLFNVTIDWLISDPEHELKKVKKLYISRRVVITLLSILLVWFIATFAYVILRWFVRSDAKIWLTFIYAIPVSSIIALVFTAIWAKSELVPIPTAFLIWTLVLSLYLSLPDFSDKSFIFLIAIPLQVCDILWYVLIKLIKIDRKKKERLENENRESTEDDIEF